MSAERWRFDRFVLDCGDRRLMCDGMPVDLNARYFDALVLLVEAAGALVSKDRFLDEAWRGVPVTDEALTQCIRTLRRQLGDDAARPRFIATVPKHGYRFVAAVERAGDGGFVAGPASDGTWGAWRRWVQLGGAGTIGAGVAGVIGGLGYGLAAAQADGPGTGAVSMVLVVLWLTLAMALTGGAGVSFGIAAATVLSSRRWWRIGGGAIGGMVIGGIVKLLGIDAFNLLFGRSPGGITGAMEGMMLGAAVGAGAWLVERQHAGPRRAMAIAAPIGAAGGALVPLLGGRMMGGSLDLLAATFRDSRLHLDRLGGVFGEAKFGPVSQIVMGGAEGALFAACIVGAMTLARRRIDSSR